MLLLPERERDITVRTEFNFFLVCMSVRTGYIELSKSIGSVQRKDGLVRELCGVCGMVSMQALPNGLLFIYVAR